MLRERTVNGFLSTLSLRRATVTSPKSVIYLLDISIHALLAESDPLPRSGTVRGTYFYPRSPCGERPLQPMRQQPPQTFLSTLSLRRATDRPPTGYYGRAISIHALLAESDYPRVVRLYNDSHFYPRSPCGERRFFMPYGAELYDISIHALLAESDVLGAVTSPAVIRFLSTLSLRRATNKPTQRAG